MKIANIITSDFLDGLTIQKGINSKQISQLINFTQTDPLIENFTSDKTRFASIETFEHWRKKDTHFYTLCDKDENLLGIFWFNIVTIPWYKQIGGKNPSYYGITLGVRIYSDARGKGLSVQFIKTVLSDYYNSSEYKSQVNKGIWLAVSLDNYPAIASYKKSGFKELGIREDGKKLLMFL